MSDTDILCFRFELRIPRALLSTLAKILTNIADRFTGGMDVAALSVLDWSGDSVDAQQLLNLILSLVLDQKFIDMSVSVEQPGCMEQN